MLKKTIFRKLVIQDSSQIYEKIYISRQLASVRKIKNEDDVIKILINYGFHILKAEELNFWDQIRLFSNCKHLISIHGAGLTNCIFIMMLAN